MPKTIIPPTAASEAQAVTLAAVIADTLESTLAKVRRRNRSTLKISKILSEFPDDVQLDILNVIKSHIPSTPPAHPFPSSQPVD